VSNPKVVTVFIFGLFFPIISLSCTKVDWCKFVLVMSRDYDYIKDLKNDLDIWKIIFGVLDSWIVTGCNENQHTV